MSYRQRLTRYYLWYTACFFGFLFALALLEREGMPRLWIGYLFMFATIALYATTVRSRPARAIRALPVGIASAGSCSALRW